MYVWLGLFWLVWGGLLFGLMDLLIVLFCALLFDVKCLILCSCFGVAGVVLL